MDTTNETQATKTRKPTKSIADLEAARAAIVREYDAARAEADRLRDDTTATDEQRRAAYQRAWSFAPRIKAASAAITRAKNAANPTYAGSGLTNLKVATPYGTFSRRTPRAYTHLIVVRETEAYRQRSLTREIADQEKQIAEYTAKLPKCDANGVGVEVRRNSYDGSVMRFTHNYREYITGCRQSIVDARERAARPREWFAFRWSQSLKNAMAGVRSLQTGYHQPGDHEVHVYEVATGKEVV